MSLSAAADAPVLSLGEALVEFMPAATGTPMAAAEHWRRFAGGAPATFAAAMVRLGRPAALVTRVGDDPFSDYLLAACAAAGVDTSHARRTPDRQLGVCFHEFVDGQVHLRFERAASAATTLTADDLDVEAVDRAAAVHVTGTLLQIGTGPRSFALTAMERARAAGVPVSFDPNVRRLPGAGNARAAFEQALALADVTMPTRAEAAELTGHADPVAAAGALRALGVRLVAVTLAGDGCVLLGAGDDAPRHCPAYAVDVVEPTGAGDCHAAGLLTGFLAGWDSARTGAYANAAGALAVTAMGHFGAALPTPRGIDALQRTDRRAPRDTGRKR